MSNSRLSASQPRLVLASASPRRAALLKSMGFRFDVCPADIDEIPAHLEEPKAYVQRMASSKAAAVARSLSDMAATVVLGADTSVIREGTILGKPLDAAHGVEMLVSLSDRSHEVITSVCVTDGLRQEVRVVVTVVTFRRIGRDEALAYWHTGEAADKAGGYGIQGIGGIFATRISGSYSAVVGLPQSETHRLLSNFAVYPSWSVTL